MGYDYTIQGRVRPGRPFKMSELTSPADWDVAGSPPENWLRCVGRRQEYFGFATENKWCGNFYVKLMKRLPADGGSGMAVITGEWTHDGGDRLLIARDRMAAVPLRRMYDPRSPWAEVYRRSHYMCRPGADKMASPTPTNLSAITP